MIGLYHLLMRLHNEPLFKRLLYHWMAQLQYIISVLQPPQDYISSLQKVFIDFVWQGL